MAQGAGGHTSVHNAEEADSYQLLSLCLTCLRSCWKPALVDNGGGNESACAHSPVPLGGSSRSLLPHSLRYLAVEVRLASESLFTKWKHFLNPAFLLLHFPVPTS